ncbi:dual specificity phosphatase, partial [Protomyces lactucae-debilis]
YTSGPVCVVHPHLWLFANPTAAQAKEYDVVINVAKEIASPLLEEASGHEEPTVPPRKLAGVEYVHVPWQHNASLAQDLPSLTAYMDRCLKQEKRVLVHCQQGVSRSASLVIAYVMKSMGKDVNEAYGFVKHESPWIGPNMTLIYQLCEWGKLLKR